MRIYHRYLGYFLAGIMAVYATSGIIMIFRDTDFLKFEKVVQRKIAPNLPLQNLGRELRMREVKVVSETDEVLTFEQGTYNKKTGDVEYTVKEWPEAINKITSMHKATTGKPLFFLNIFFGVSLFFFVLSAFWMFLPRTSVFKKGLYFAAAGVVLTLVMIFVG